MDYNTTMNYELYAGKSLLLLGKTRSLAKEEFETLLKLHDIKIKDSYDQEVALIIEGRMMNPIEQQESARLYEEERLPIIDISEIEKWLCNSIEPNRLLMSLKLSRDQERLIDFIQNPYISDLLFFRLLKLYDWKGEGFFDTDGNRDVTAAIIGRFYVEIERNHNVQYAMSGLAHLIEKYGTRELIDAIAELSPITKEIRDPKDCALHGVLDAMALHPETSDLILLKLLSARAPLIAHREPLTLETHLLGLNNDEINKILATNTSLSNSGADRMEQIYPELIAQFYPLDESRFERLLVSYGEALALNISLSDSMQELLMGMKQEGVYHNLASNRALSIPYLEEIFELERFGVALGSNPSLPLRLIERLYMGAHPESLKALASNPSTPIEILYQLSLDQRYERAVKTNATYGQHIQTYNIGWN